MTLRLYTDELILNAERKNPETVSKRIHDKMPLVFFANRNNDSRAYSTGMIDPV